MLVANFPQMNFTQMHERLRQELLRRIQRGTLTVSLLGRQTGLGQSHLSNYLHKRRQLSLGAMDRILEAQQMTAADLIPAAARDREPGGAEGGSISLVSHAVALFEPHVRPGSVQATIEMPKGVLRRAPVRMSTPRRKWERFVAVRIDSADAPAMEPLILPGAIVLVDRHYNSLTPLRAGRPNLYAVRHGAHLRLRYVEFVANRLVLRPHNLAYPVELVELGGDETPNEMIAGRVALILNEP